MLRIPDRLLTLNNVLLASPDPVHVSHHDFISGCNDWIDFVSTTPNHFLFSKKVLPASLDFVRVSHIEFFSDFAAALSFSSNSVPISFSHDVGASVFSFRDQLHLTASPPHIVVQRYDFTFDPSGKVTLSFQSKLSQSIAFHSFPLLLLKSPAIVDFPTTRLLSGPVSEMCEYEFHKKQSSAGIVTIRLFSPYLGKFQICLLQLHFNSYNYDLFWMDFVELVKRLSRKMHRNLFRSFRSLDAILVIHCDSSEDFDYALQLFDQMPKCLAAVWVAITLEYTNIGFDVIAFGVFKVKQKGGITLANYIKMNLCFWTLLNYELHDCSLGDSIKLLLECGVEVEFLVETTSKTKFLPIYMLPHLGLLTIILGRCLEVGIAERHTLTFAKKGYVQVALDVDFQRLPMSILGNYEGLEEAKSTVCHHVTYGKGKLQIIQLIDGHATDIGIFLAVHAIEALVHDHLIAQKEKASHVVFPFYCVFFAHAFGLFSTWVQPIFSHCKKQDNSVALFGLVYYAGAVWVTSVCWTDHSPNVFWAKEFPPYGLGQIAICVCCLLLLFLVLGITLVFQADMVIPISA